MWNKGYIYQVSKITNVSRLILTPTYPSCHSLADKPCPVHKQCLP